MRDSGEGRIGSGSTLKRRNGNINALRRDEMRGEVTR